MASTLDRAQLLNYTRAGVGRHLKSAMGVDLRRIYVKFNLVFVYVKRNDSCVVRSASECGPFNRRLTSVFLERSGVKRTMQGRGFLAHIVHCCHKIVT